MYSLLTHNRHSSPRAGLSRDLDTVLGSLFSGDAASLEGISTYSPRVNIIDTATAVRISAELPGIDEKDASITIADDQLVIQGEKKIEQEENVQGRHYMERGYGTFKRVFNLPEGLDVPAAQATFKKGILTIHLPKKAEAQRTVRKLDIKSE